MKKCASWVVRVVVGAVVGVGAVCAAAEPENLVPRVRANYEKMRLDLIRAEQRAGVDAVNHWDSFLNAMHECRWDLHDAILNSAAYQAYAAARPDDSAADDAFSACMGMVDAPELAAEAERVLKRFDKSAHWREIERFWDPVSPRFVFEPVPAGEYPIAGKAAGVRDAKGLTRGLEARIVIAARDNDLQAFRTTIHRVAVVSRVLALSGDMMSQRTAETIRAIIVRRLVSIDLPAGFPAAAIEEFSRVPMPRWALAIECEMLDVWETIDMVNRQGVEKLHHGPVGLMNALMMAVVATQMDEMRMLEAIYVDLQMTFEADPAVRGPAARRAGLAWTLLDHRWTRWRYPLSAMLAPASGGERRSARANRMEFEGGLAALAVAAFREETGRVPGSIDELVPKYISATPKDWYAEQPGVTPLRYRRLDPATDAAGRVFVLYSLGADNTDNDGKEPKEAPGDAFIKPGIGTDFVVSRRSVKY